jgi:chromosome segregation ATPase
VNVLKMIDEIDTLVTNSASIATIKPKLATLKEHTQALDNEVSVVKIANEKLQTKIVGLETENTDLKAEVAKLQAVDDPAATDMCKYCKRRKGKVINIKKHPVFGNMGLEIHYYRCTACGQEYEREHNEGGGPQMMVPSGRG